MKIYKLKENRLKESESNEIQMTVPLKNNKTGEETTINLLNYTDTSTLIKGCLETLNADTHDLQDIVISNLGDKKLEDTLNDYSYDIIRYRHRSDYKSLTELLNLFPVSLKELDKSKFFDFFFGYEDESNLFKWYIHSKKKYPTETKDGESILAYFNSFGSFNILDYYEKYIGYFTSKEDWFNSLIKRQMEVFELPNEDSGIYFVIKRYLKNIDFEDIIDTISLGKYIYKKYDLKEYTPSKIGEIRKTLKLNPEPPFNPIQFIGDYEDYEDFEISDKNKQFLDSHSKEIQIMEDPQLYKDEERYQLNNDENFFYSRVAYNYIKVVHYTFKYFFEDEYSLFKKFLDLDKLINEILTRAFYTKENFYFERYIANLLS